MLYQRLKYSLVLIGVGVFLSLSATAQSIIYVNHAAVGADNGTSWDDAFEFLQDALAVAGSGAEIWVAAGTYTPDRGVGITSGDREASFILQSSYSLIGGFLGTETDRAQRDPLANETILSGDLAGNDVQGTDPFGALKSDNATRILYVDVPVGLAAPVIDGFSIVRGNAIGPNLSGAALRVERESHIRISNVTFLENFACAWGGAILSEGTFILEHSRFHGNSVMASNPSCSGTFGGGGAITQWYRENETPRIDDVLFESNVSPDGYPSGGAVASIFGPIHIWNSVFVGNRAAEAGAIYVKDSPAHSLFYNNVFIDNEALKESGGAVVLEESTATFANALFVGNSALSGCCGGAISAYESPSWFEVFNATFVGNTAPKGTAIHSTGSVSPEVWNSIFWDNGVEGAVVIDRQRDNPLILGNNIFQGLLPDGVSSTGSLLDTDPRFVNPAGADQIPGTIDDDFRLSAGSPAIDAGDNLRLPADSLDLDLDGNFDELLPVDLLNNVRIFDGGSGTATVDIGAYEFGAPPVVLAIDLQVGVPKTAPLLSAAYPNPFHSTTTISYTLPAPSDVRLEVFDLLGRRVIVLAEGVESAGEHRVSFDATGLSSGLYIYSLTTEGFLQTRKMILLK